NLIYRGGHLQNIITVDPNLLEQVEVIYGPASVAYGSDALGGVVVMSTPVPRLSVTGKVTFSGEAVSRYSSVNDGTLLHTGFHIGGTRFASYTSLSYNKFGDLRSGRSTNPFMKGDSYISRPFDVVHQGGEDILVSNPKSWMQTGSGYSQYDLLQKFLFRQTDRISHSFNFQFSNSGDIPRYDRLTDMKNADTPKFAQWYYGPQTRLLTSYALETEDWAGADNFSVIAAYQNLRESRNNRKLNDLWLGIRKENVHVVSLTSDWIKNVNATHRLHAGIDASLQYLHSDAFARDIDTGERKPLDTRYPDGHNHMHNIDLFFSHTWQINSRLIFSDGVRVGYSSLRSTHHSAEFFPLHARWGTVRQDNPTCSLSAGVAYNPSDTWKLALNVSTGYRVPNIDDVGKVFDSEPGMVVIPNPGVKPEKTVSADLNVATFRNEVVEWNASLYATYMFDAIALAPALFNGEAQTMYDGELSDVYANRNNSRACAAGASTTVKVYMSENFSADAAITYTYGNMLGRNGEADMPLDHISPLFGRVGVAFESSCRRVKAEIFALFNGRKPLSRYNLNGEDNIGYATENGLDGKGLPAWFTLNLRASYTPHKRVTVQGGIENLLDTEYRTFGSGINAPGRNVYCALRLSF
ncbi:MAG: TonB-dependent receptor, partial [Coprobacter sp.]|nr:TonB-dependent receptor [Coprobacter sp.]